MLPWNKSGAEARVWVSGSGNCAGEPCRAVTAQGHEHGRYVLLRTEVSARACDRWNIGRRKMGITDKAKAQASHVAQKTQEAARSGKAKLDKAQANQRANAMLQQLGALVYTERTGHGTADSRAKIDKQISDISAHEQENGLNMTGQ
jgi:hypothetical protein